MAQQEKQLTPAILPSFASIETTPTNKAITVISGQIVEISSLGEAVYGNWRQAAASTTFDFYVPADGTRNYEVPADITTLKITSAGNVVAIVY